MSNVSKQSKIILQPIPFIYALTAEVEEHVLEAVREVGFKAIFSMLNTVSVKYIIENAGL